MAKSKEVIEELLELVKGYYHRIGRGKNMDGAGEFTQEEIMDWLQDDLQHLEGEMAVITANKLINPEKSDKEKILKIIDDRIFSLEEQYIILYDAEKFSNAIKTEEIKGELVALRTCITQC